MTVSPSYPVAVMVKQSTADMPLLGEDSSRPTSGGRLISTSTAARLPARRAVSGDCTELEPVPGTSPQAQDWTAPPPDSAVAQLHLARSEHGDSLPIILCLSLCLHVAD